MAQSSVGTRDMTSLPARHRRRGSALSSISTPASAATPARSTARNGTPAAIRAPLTDLDALRRRAQRRVVQPHPHLRGRRRAGQPHRAFPALVPALRGAGLRHRLSDRRLLQARARTASSSSTRISASAASCAPGPAPMARASSTTMQAS